MLASPTRDQPCDDGSLRGLALVPQIGPDFEALGVKVNHTQMASGDIAHVTDVDDLSYDTSCLWRPLRSSAPTPAPSSPGGTVTTSGRRGVTAGRLRPRVQPAADAHLRKLCELDGDAAARGRSRSARREDRHLSRSCSQHDHRLNPPGWEGLVAISSNHLQLLGVSKVSPHREGGVERPSLRQTPPQLGATDSFPIVKNC